MSSAADVIARLDQFIDDVNALLAASTLESVVEIIEEVGGGDVIRDLAREFSALLSSLRQKLAELLATIEQPLRHAQALAGLLGLLGPVMTGLERLVSTTAQDLADAGLDQVVHITEPITFATRFGRNVLETGEGVLELLPPPDKLRELDHSFAELIATVDSYAEAAAP